jgi:hypothetical protein
MSWMRFQALKANLVWPSLPSAGLLKPEMDLGLPTGLQNLQNLW